MAILLIMLAASLIAGCKQETTYRSLGGDFYWYVSSERADQPAPIVHLVINDAGKFIEIATGVTEDCLVIDADHIVYFAHSSGTRVRGLYVYKRGVGSRLITPMASFIWTKTQDGLAVEENGTKKVFTSKQITNLFEVKKESHEGK